MKEFIDVDLASILIARNNAVDLGGDRSSRCVFEFSISADIIAAVIADDARSSCGIVGESQRS